MLELTDDDPPVQTKVVAMEVRTATLCFGLLNTALIIYFFDHHLVSVSQRLVINMDNSKRAVDSVALDGDDINELEAGWDQQQAWMLR